MRELLLDVDPSLPRRAGLEQAIRAAVRTGRLLPDTVLPSSRTLAADLGLSRATVVSAYEQLTVEGYLVSRQGAGTRVAPRPAPRSVDPPQVGPPSSSRLDDPARASPQHDLRPGEPDHTLFPRSAWSRSMRRAVNELPMSGLGYGDPRGEPQLRRVIAEHLGRSRAVSTEPDHIRIFGGTSAALGFLGEALRRRGSDAVAVEDPGLPILHQAMALTGLTITPIPVDDHGLAVGRLDDHRVGAVLTTPAHQYPMGVTLSAERRADLMDWADRTDGFVIEDDYDGEFRFDRSKIGALQGLAPDRVVYLGTASKSLAPGLRLAWAAVPPALLPDLDRVMHMRAAVSTIEQSAMADFVDRGDLDRHLRQARAEYGRRRSAVRGVLDEIPWLHVSPAGAGLHLTAVVDTEHRPGAETEADLVATGARRSLALLGLGPHWAGRPRAHGLVIGFSRPPTHRFRATLDLLTEIFG